MAVIVAQSPARLDRLSVRTALLAGGDRRSCAGGLAAADRGPTPTPTGCRCSTRPTWRRSPPPWPTCRRRPSAGRGSSPPASARRWPATAVGAGGLAAVAIGIGFWSVVTDTRSRARAARRGGASAWPRCCGPATSPFHGLTALVTAAAIVPPVSSRATATPAAGSAAQSGRWPGLGRARLPARRRRRRPWPSSLADKDLIEGARRSTTGWRPPSEADDDVASVRLGEAVRHLSGADATLSSWFVEPAAAAADHRPQPRGRRVADPRRRRRRRGDVRRRRRRPTSTRCGSSTAGSTPRR